MKRDVIIAVIVGFILGGIGAIATVNLPSLFKNIQPPKRENVAEELTPPPTPVITEVSGNLEITTPVAESIVTDKELKITGRTKVGDVVVVESENDITSSDVKDDGTFSASLTLGEGENTITFYSVNDGGEESKSITVYYTSDKL